MIAYRFEKEDAKDKEGKDLKVGFVFSSRERDFSTWSENKQRVEEALEKERLPKFPSRKNCVFVCFSEENAEEWARNMLLNKHINSTSYKLLKLEVTNDVYWFRGEEYNMLYLHKVWTDELLQKTAEKYWGSYCDSPAKLEVGHEWEGLLDGDARIVDITVKNITTIDYKTLGSNE